MSETDSNFMSRRNKIHPESEENSAFEMEDTKTNNKQLLMKLKNVANEFKNDATTSLNMIANLKQGAARWKHYATHRRKFRSSGGTDRRHTGGIGLCYEVQAQDHVDTKQEEMTGTQRQMITANNRNLIEYFSRLGSSKNENESVNLDYVTSLLKNGALINCTDKYGQTIFHEVARTWHTDVAQFLIENDADVNQADAFGRTPLHTCAAVDYADMCTFLIQNGANKEARTRGENQTPLHYAAKNDACSSLKALLKEDCEYKEVRDYKGRTPIHLAAELDRSETARLLLELDDPAPVGVEDDSGQAAIVPMITKMPLVANEALNQFHTTDRANRKQHFHLHHMEPRKPGDDRRTYPQTALHVAVAFKKYDLIVHPVFLTLISTKWTYFGRRGAVLNTCVNLSFILLWTVQGLIPDSDYTLKYKYNMPQDWWRILLFLLAAMFTIWQITDELLEFRSSKKSHRQWKEWREQELQRDIEFSHPRWPQEEQYLRQEIENLDKASPRYFNDFWNVFDWLVYLLLTVCIITHLVDVFAHSNQVARTHIRIMSVTIILIWLRLFKNARAFSTLGPFIVMLSHMTKDIFVFFSIYLGFYIPYACAFWMLFGGTKVRDGFTGMTSTANDTVTVTGYDKPNALMFSLFRLTLVDDYDYDGMKAVDYIMADVMVGTWLGLSAIVMLNLFIALMVYDNAKANAVMQKAITILGIEEGMSKSRKEKFREYIHTACCPLEDAYDDDANEPGDEDLKKVTIQIKEQLDVFSEDWDEFRHNTSLQKEQLDDMQEQLEAVYRRNSSDDDPPSRRGGASSGIRSKSRACDQLAEEVLVVKDAVQDLQQHQKDFEHRYRRDMHVIKSCLQQLSASAGGAGLRDVTTPRAEYPHPAAGRDDVTAWDTGRLQPAPPQPLLVSPVTASPRPPVTPAIPVRPSDKNSETDRKRHLRELKKLRRDLRGRGDQRERPASDVIFRKARSGSRERLVPDDVTDGDDGVFPTVEISEPMPSAELKSSPDQSEC